MSDLHIRRIRKRLLQDYGELIDVSDVAERPPEEVESNLLTRSQAALVLSHLAEIPAEESANNVVDGFEDNGIDAVYFDEARPMLYVVQSKWVSRGNKSIDVGSVEKFVRGFKDLLAARFDRFNDKVQKQRETIEDALDTPDVLITLVIAYTGTQPLSGHAERVLNDVRDEHNNPTELLSIRVYTQKELYEAISGQFEGKPINLEVTLRDWGKVEAPYMAYYGRVSAAEIAQWYSEHDTRLFARNLRKFRSDTEVNRQIKTTLVREPDKFWYFNNGVTVLCNKIGKKPLGGANRDVGHFHCEGVSVVNGAQTVGNIATSVQQGFEKATQAYVLVRFISLENCPPDFAREVTTATNTQNRIEPRDFASLDPNQERLRKELLLDREKLYVYKSGDQRPEPQNGCTIEDATIALACAYPSIQLAAHAKSALGKLWEDIKERPYTLLFNDQLSALRMWNCVEIMRAVDAVLEREKAHPDGIHRRVAIHGNRFILHRVFQSLPLHEFDHEHFKIDPIKTKAADETLRVIDEITAAINEQFKHVYLNNFFKSVQKCLELTEQLPPLPEPFQTDYLDATERLKQQALFSDDALSA